MDTERFFAWAHPRVQYEVNIVLQDQPTLTALVIASTIDPRIEVPDDGANLFDVEAGTYIALLTLRNQHRAIVLFEKPLNYGLIEDAIERRVMFQHGALGRHLTHDPNSLFVEFINDGGGDTADLSSADRRQDEVVDDADVGVIRDLALTDRDLVFHALDDERRDMLYTPCQHRQSLAMADLSGDVDLLSLLDRLGQLMLTRRLTLPFTIHLVATLPHSTALTPIHDQRALH